MVVFDESSFATQMSDNNLERLLEGAVSNSEAGGAFDLQCTQRGVSAFKFDHLDHVSDKGDSIHNENANGNYNDDCSPLPDPKVLCQTVNKNFNKTPKGKIFEEDLKDIFCLMVLQLNLKNESNGKKSILSKNHPFSFTTEQALLVLNSLSYNIENSLTVISLSYTINKTIGLISIDKFFDAHMLHCPGDRTRKSSKPGTLLQPTPKGVSIIRKFVEKNGIKFSKIPPVLISPLSSMDLFYFDHNYLNDKIIYSHYLIKLLFVKIFSHRPNVWSPMNPPERFKINYNLHCYATNPMNVTESGLVVSPLHHKYFTNPESDSHIQYYSSNLGVRVFLNKMIDGIKYNYCVSGKAIVQWLMDCTDILSVKSAIEVGNLFLSLNFLLPILQNPLKSSNTKKFLPHSDVYYFISDRGKKISLWYKHSNSTNSRTLGAFSNRAKNKLNTHKFGLSGFLNDPGLKYLFKIHLTREFCSENFDAYLQLQKFHKKFNLLTKLLNYIELNRADISIYGGRYKNQLLKFSNDCLALAYHIYFTYLSPKASFVLNIDYNLRSKITAILIENDPGVANGFYGYNDIYYGSETGTPVSVKMSSSQSESPPVDAEGSNHGLYATFPSSFKLSTNSSTNSSTGYTPPSISKNYDSKDIGQSDNGSQKIQDQVVLNDTSSIFSCDSGYGMSDTSSSHKQSIPESPRDVQFDVAYTSLIGFAPFATELMNQLFRLMEVDSFPKFLDSELFADYEAILEE